MKKIFSNKILFLFAFSFIFATVSPVFSGSNQAQAAAGACSPKTSTTVQADITACNNTTDENTCKNNTKCLWADQNSNAFVTTICNAYLIITGTGGKAFAAFAIISLGIGFFTGKVSWGLMIGVAAGIAAMFGAPTIVSAISGSSSGVCVYQNI